MTLTPVLSSYMLKGGNEHDTIMVRLMKRPYLRMLRNRLEKVQEKAVEASPLAPRGA